MEYDMVYIPKYIINRVKWYMEKQNVGKADALKYSIRDAIGKGKITEGDPLYKMWYYDDYRLIAPDIYIPKYLDFKKYPFYSLQ